MLALSNSARLFIGQLAFGLLMVAPAALAQTTFSPTDTVQTLTPADVAPAPEPETAVTTAAEPTAVTAAPEAPEVAVVAPAMPAAAVAPDSATFNELRQLNEKWEAATVRNDAETMNQLMAAEYVSINSNGRVLQRADLLRAIADGKAKTEVNKGFDYLIRVYGDVGMVMHNTSFVGSLNGVNTSGQYRAMHLYVRRGGRWQLTSSQNTFIAPTDPRASLSARR